MLLLCLADWYRWLSEPADVSLNLYTKKISEDMWHKIFVDRQLFLFRTNSAITRNETALIQSSHSALYFPFFIHYQNPRNEGLLPLWLLSNASNLEHVIKTERTGKAW